MNTITALLDAIRVRSTVYLSKTVRPPFGMEIARHDDAWRFHLVLHGGTWVSVRETGEQARLDSGDFVIVARGHAHALSDTPDRPVSSHHQIPAPDPLAGPGLADCATEQGETLFLCGYFRFADGTPGAFLDQLPGLLVTRADSAAAPGYLADIVAIIQEELQASRAGPMVVLNRLTEVLLYHAISQWTEREMTASGTLAGLADERLQRALAAIHDEPARHWTVEELARIAGHSRTGFATKFRDATGVTPMGYVTHWRLEQARRLLAESDFSLEAVAARVGYADANAFSRAFRRAAGASPAAYRRASRG